MKSEYFCDKNALIYLSLGSNQGNSRAYLEQAITALSEQLQLIQRSTTIQTQAMYVTDQNDFLNMMLAMRDIDENFTHPHDLLNFCKNIENAVGRVPTFRYGPRVIDIDIIAYGHYCHSDTHITIPHAKFRERNFVLNPFCEIAPDYQDPISGMTIKNLLKRLED